MADATDNCQATFNPSQANVDRDPAGDLCDCSSGDPAVYPGANEQCGDGKDNDCNGLVDCGDPACTVQCLVDAGAPDGGETDAGFVDGGPGDGGQDAGEDGGTADSGVDAGGPPGLVGRYCRADRWCWSNPAMPATSINSSWSGGANDVWVVGNDGGAQHWNGADWTVYQTPVAGHLYAAYGVGGNLWAVGEAGAVVRWNGASWQAEDSGTTARLRAVSGSGGALWAVGNAGVALRGDGLGRWDGGASTGTSEDLLAVLAVDVSHVFAAGAAGTLLGWNGTGWSTLFGPATGDVVSLWGTSSTDVWAVELPGLVLNWNGTSWGYNTPGWLVSWLTGASSSDIWAVGRDAGYHWNGAEWTDQATPACKGLRRLQARASDAVDAVCADGSIFRWNGQSWLSVVSPPSTGSVWSFPLNGIWASSTTDVWAVGDLNPGNTSVDEFGIHWDGAAWSVQTLGFQTGSTRYTGVWGLDASNVYFVGDTSLILLNGNYPGPYGIDFASFYAVGGLSSTDLWFVGATNRYWNGGAWGYPTPPSTLFGVWAGDASNVWAVGAGGFAGRWNGSNFSPETTGTGATLYGVWGSSPTNVWAVGGLGVALRWNGATWQSVPSGTSLPLRAVWGSGPSDVWAVGGVTLHFDGNTWAVTDSNSALELNSVWGVSATSAWAAGADGVVLEFRP